jgi:PHAX RNA-binding domain
MDPLTANKLAEILHEPKRFLLQKILRTVGPDLVADVLVATLQCEANGGMLTKDGTRRRTPGGAFFTLMKARVTAEQRRQLFPWNTPSGPRRPPREPQTPTWDEVQPLITQLATTRAGEARVMKLTLIGRPGKVEIRKDCVLLRMQGKAPGNFPKGLPPVPKQAQ